MNKEKCDYCKAETNIYGPNLLSVEYNGKKIRVCHDCLNIVKEKNRANYDKKNENVEKLDIRNENKLLEG